MKKAFLGHKHPWIFSGAIETIEQSKSSLHGGLVSVYCDNVFLAHGYYNMKSQIAVRILSWNEDSLITKEFFIQAIKQAQNSRQAYLDTKETTVYRLIFAESDFLPGFIVDVYDTVCVLQIHTLGAENLKKLFVEALETVLAPTAIYEKSDIPSRRMEGLSPLHEELLVGALPEYIEVKEYGMKFLVDIQKGQKTGFFIDQRENRAALHRYVAGKHVHNICGYTGGFSVAALHFGAQHVTTVDISSDAIEAAKDNITRNGIDTVVHTGVVMDAFEYVKNLEKSSVQMIILDPPAFAKSKKDVDRAIKGYLSLNQLALEALEEEGILMTCSCSSMVTDEQFFRMLAWASQAAGCQVQVVEKRSQAFDHPLTPYFPEGEYLKCYIVRKKQLP